MKRLLVATASLLLAGCGYFGSGQWEDDPGKWERAFGASAPPGVTVVHSLYWRSPRWTYEAAHLFELRTSPAFRANLVDQNKLRQLSNPAASDYEPPCIEECPSWFMPKPPASYEVWTSGQPGHRPILPG